MLVLTTLRHLRESLSAGLVYGRCQPSVVTAVVLLMAVSLTAGCGSGAFRAPSGRPGATNSPSLAGSPTPSGSAKGKTYTYSLPVGDTPNAQDDAVVYMYLLRGDCAFAQKYLDQTWYRLSMQGPRQVLMLQAGIEMCRRNDSAARSFVQIAETRYGWSGLAHDEWSCNIYRATGSMWLQVPQSSLSCPGGQIPLWPGNSQFSSGRPCEDPRVGTGECPSAPPSITPTTPPPTTPTTPTESSSAEATANTSVPFHTTSVMT